MPRIEMTDAQAAVLHEVLSQLVSDLGMEIAATERLEFRDQLKTRRRLLSEIRSALEHAQPKAA